MKHPPKKCENCGAEFSPKYRVTATYWAKRRFCSEVCKHVALKGQRRSTFGKERVPLADRFWSKVEKGSKGRCWQWTGAQDVRGYGYLFNRRKPNVLAHRLSYELHHGPIPEGMCVCHHCDNPLCVNPAHLFLGTRADNNADKGKKGREADRRGERNPRAKLNEESIRLVRQLRAKGMTQQQIADQVGVSQVQVSRVLRGEAWKEV